MDAPSRKNLCLCRRAVGVWGVVLFREVASLVLPVEPSARAYSPRTVARPTELLFVKQCGPRGLRWRGESGPMFAQEDDGRAFPKEGE
jgi:hypothetical protein